MHPFGLTLKLKLKLKNGEGSFLIQAAGQWGDDERAIIKIQARWYPRVYVRQAQGQGWMTIFGDRLPKDLEPSTEEAEGRYIGPDEIMAQVVEHKWAKKSIVKACLEAQWDTKSEYRRALKIEDIPGLGPNYLWELDASEWDIYPVYNTYTEILKRKINANTSGARRSARRSVHTIRVAPENIGHQIDFQKRQAQVDKSKFRKVLADPNSTVKQVEIWTDGAQGNVQATGGMQPDKTVLGSGLRVVYDGAEADYADMFLESSRSRHEQWSGTSTH